MSNKVPQINTDSESVAPDHPSYAIDGKYYRVAAPSELGVRQIQMLMRTSQRVQPLVNALTGASEEIEEEEFEEAKSAARAIVTMTSDIPEDVELSELELVGYVSGFLQELTATIEGSQRLRFR